MLRIGVVGCGAIGSQICKAVDKELEDVELYAIYDRQEEHISRLRSQLINEDPKAMDIEEMVKHVDLIVEAATQAAVPQIVRTSLKAGCDVMIMSVGAFACLDLLEEAMELARQNSCKIYLPSGAVAGLDGLRSASAASIYSVSLTTTKPPRGLAGAPYVIKNNIELEKITERTVIFEGKASEAVKAFPANVNVAATLSLSGIGFDKTDVKVVADPHLKRNTHEITVEGDFGTLTAKVENVPAPTNPKTSYLAALSAISTLKKISSPLQIGT